MAIAANMQDMMQWQFKQTADQINRDFEHRYQTLGKKSVEFDPANEYIFSQTASQQKVPAKRVVVFRRQVEYDEVDYGYEWEDVANWVSSSECAKWCIENAAVPLRLIYEQNHERMSWNIAVLAYFEPKVLTAYLLKWKEQ